MLKIYEILRNVYSKILNTKTYLIEHYPKSKYVKKILCTCGYKRIKAINRKDWKILPIFSEYYCAYNLSKEKVFVKALFNNDFGCARREYDVLKIITDSGFSICNMIPKPLEIIEIENGSLLITKYESLPLLLDIPKDEIDFNALFLQIQSYLIDMQNLGIIHADIRPKNILWDSRIHEIKVIDFGMAYCKQLAETDMIYGSLKLPKELEGTGCGIYNPSKGIFDDAYAILKTVEELEPDFSKKFPAVWKKLNGYIGNNKVKLFIN